LNIIEKQQRGLMVPRAGYIEWSLKGRAISHRLVEPPLMITHDVGAWNAAMGSTTICRCGHWCQDESTWSWRSN
jgi:hypothetical protein